MTLQGQIDGSGFGAIIRKVERTRLGKFEAG